MQITNKLNLPYGLVKAVSPDPHNKPGEISATTLIQGMKQVILTQRHWEDLEDDVADRIWAVFGTAVHALLENEGEEDFCEIELIGTSSIVLQNSIFPKKNSYLRFFITHSV